MPGGRPPKIRNIYDRPTCPCGKRLVAYSRSYGKVYWRSICSVCADLKYKTPEQIKKKNREATRRQVRKKRNEKLKPCTSCGFQPTHSCQMDWDHIDGNCQDNDPKNLQLLCANCHRLKTWLNRDFASSRHSKQFLIETSEVQNLRNSICDNMGLERVDSSDLENQFFGK